MASHTFYLELFSQSGRKIIMNFHSFFELCCMIQRLVFSSYRARGLYKSANRDNEVNMRRQGLNIFLLTLGSREYLGYAFFR